MNRLFLVFICLFLSFNSIIAQSNYSIQVNGGIIHPQKSSDGLTGTIQFHYSVTPKIYLYFSTGYLAWDNQYYTYMKNDKPFRTPTADDHKLVPVFIGGKYDLHNNAFLTSFLNVEIGYSSLSCNSYPVSVNNNPDGTVEVVTDYSGRKEITDNLFCVGIGAGLSHPVSQTANLVVAFMLNSYVSENYYGLFSANGTYTSFSAGFNFKI